MSTPPERSDDTAPVGERPLGLAAAVIDPGTGRAHLTHVSAALGRELGRPDGPAVGSAVDELIGPKAWAALGDRLGNGSGCMPIGPPAGADDASQALLHWSVHPDGPEPGGGQTLLLAVEEAGRQRLVRSLRHRALHDALTGLPNRTLVLELLAVALREADRDGYVVAVVYLDVDDLKSVNESLGHEAGDELLTTVGHRLRRTLRGSDVAGRLSGDEFAVVCPRLHDEHEAAAIGDRILETVAGPCLLAGQEVVVSVSIGIATGSEAGATAPAVLLNRSDEALRRAKRAGKGRFVIFDEDLDREVRERQVMVGELRHAASSGQLRLRYQPVVDLTDGHLIGAEALVRWQHPRRGLLEPVDFLQVAEDSGSIVEVGAWVLDEACAQAARWDRPGERLRSVSINVSARQLGHGAVVAELRSCLDRYRLGPERVRVEVTETALTESIAARRELWDIDGLGILVGIDDFGTGYASMTYLDQMPVRFLKIDRSFVSEMTCDVIHHAIVASVTSLGVALGITVIAEGVETREQAESLVRLGCPVGQGFLYSHPVTAGELTALTAGPPPP